MDLNESTDQARRSRRRLLVGAPLAAGAAVVANVATASPAGAFMAVRNGVGATAVFGLVDVTDPAYGAVGSGAVNDAPAIQAAINAAPAGGVVFLPNGNYRLDSPLTVNRSLVTIRGASIHTRLSANFATGTAVTVNGSEVIIEGLTIAPAVGITRTGTSYAIRHPLATPTAYHHLTVRDVSIGSMGSGVELGGTLDQIENVEIRDCTPTTGVGVRINGGLDQRITRLVVANSGEPTAVQPLAGIQITGTGALLLSDSDIMAAGSAMLIDGSAFSIYAQNTFFDSSTYGLNISGSGVVSRVTFDGCWFSSSKSHGVLLNNPAIDGISFNGCDILANYGSGFHAIYGTNLLVNACRIGGNAGSGITTIPSMPSFTVTASQIGRVTDIGGLPWGFAQQYGIFINGGAYTRYLVSGNSVFGNTLGSIIDGGTTPNKYVGGNVLA